MSISRLLLLAVIVSLATYPLPGIRIGAVSRDLPVYVPLTILLAIAVGAKVWVYRRVHSNRVVWLVTALLLTSISVSTLVAPHVSGDVIARYVGFAIVPPLVLQVVRTKGDVAKCGWMLLGVCMFLTLYGFVGFFTGSSGLSSEHALSYWGIRYLPASRNSDVLYPVVGFVLGSLLIAGGLVRVSSWRGVLVLAAVVTMGVAVLLSQSRSGWISLTVGVSPILFIRRKRELWTAAASLAVIGALGITIVMLVVPPEVLDLAQARAASLKPSALDSSIAARSRVAAVALWLAVSHPLGVGLGNIHQFLSVGLYGTTWAENSYLNASVELGLAGGLAIVIYATYPLWLFTRLRVSHSTLIWATPQVGLALSLAVYLLFNVEIVSMFYWVTSSLVLATAVVGRRAARLQASNRLVCCGSSGTYR